LTAGGAVCNPAEFDEIVELPVGELDETNKTVVYVDLTARIVAQE
jgi:hypothetical protein